MIRILLVDDQNLIQEGIKALLDQHAELKVIGTVRDGRSAIKLVDILHPDIVLLDIEMPGMDGITVTKYISCLTPKTKVIILTSHEDKKYVTQALLAGAKGYILKSSLMTDLKHAILAVDHGYSQLESRLLAKVFNVNSFKLKKGKSLTASKLDRENNEHNFEKQPLEQKLNNFVSKDSEEVLSGDNAQADLKLNQLLGTESNSTISSSTYSMFLQSKRQQSDLEHFEFQSELPQQLSQETEIENLENLDSELPQLTHSEETNNLDSELPQPTHSEETNNLDSELPQLTHSEETNNLDSELLQPTHSEETSNLDSELPQPTQSEEIDNFESQLSELSQENNHLDSELSQQPNQENDLDNPNSELSELTQQTDNFDSELFELIQPEDISNFESQLSKLIKETNNLDSELSQQPNQENDLDNLDSVLSELSQQNNDLDSELPELTQSENISDFEPKLSKLIEETDNFDSELSQQITKETRIFHTNYALSHQPKTQPISVKNTDESEIKQQLLPLVSKSALIPISDPFSQPKNRTKKQFPDKLLVVFSTIKSSFNNFFYRIINKKNISQYKSYIVRYQNKLNLYINKIFMYSKNMVETFKSKISQYKNSNNQYRIKLYKYKLRLISVFKHWSEKGIFSNIGLMFVGAFIFFLIHNLLR